MSSNSITLSNITKRFRVPLDRSATLKYRFTHPRSTSRYRDLLALNDISFSVPEGQFLGIIGHNGSGKSTLLKLLARIFEPTSGKMQINGMVSPFLELGVGFNPELTARENVYLGGAIIGLSRQYLTSKFDDIIQFADLEEFADAKIKSFSSGMQVRLAFTLSIQSAAEILLMDEVLAVGDSQFQVKCFDVFARYKREGKTVILVTHDLSALTAYCDRVLLIDHGSLIGDGEPEDIIAQYVRLIRDRDNSDDEEGGVFSGKAHQEKLLPPLSIKRVTLSGEINGKNKSTFLTGEPMTIGVDVTANGLAQENMHFYLVIRRNDGQLITTMNSLGADVTLPSPSIGQSTRVYYSTEALNLYQGSYILEARILDVDGKIIDEISGVSQFHVLDERKRDGIVLIPGFWGQSTPIMAASATQATSRPKE